MAYQSNSEADMEDYLLRLASRAALYKSVARLMSMTPAACWAITQENPGVQSEPSRLYIKGVLFFINRVQVRLSREVDAADEWDLRADGVVVFDCFGNLTQEMEDLIA
jgi:hypothetical protein